jgi:hypothetical protein
MIPGERVRVAFRSAFLTYEIPVIFPNCKPAKRSHRRLSPFIHIGQIVYAFLIHCKLVWIHERQERSERQAVSIALESHGCLVASINKPQPGGHEMRQRKINAEGK